jgi:hypothetical protein
MCFGYAVAEKKLTLSLFWLLLYGLGPPPPAHLTYGAIGLRIICFDAFSFCLCRFDRLD